MFRAIYTMFFACCLLLFSCNQQGERVRLKGKQENGKPFIFRMHQFFSPAEFEVNFPLWFEDTIVSNKGIAVLKRSIYLVTGDGEEDAQLRESRNYFFNRKGKLDSMSVHYFFDDQTIGKVHFKWEGEPDPMGYRRLLSFGGTKDFLDNESAFIQFEAIRSGKNAYCYQASNYRKCFIPRRDFWGPFSVDSILKPKPEDQIVLGKARIPFKKYSVANKVHERNVQLYTYFDDGHSVRTMTRSDYPFDVKRSVIFDKDWRCIGYVDSTFSQSEFLTVTQARIFSDKRGLPVKLNKSKGGNKSPFSIVAKEEYEYIFYEK